MLKEVLEMLLNMKDWRSNLFKNGLTDSTTNLESLHFYISALEQRNNKSLRKNKLAYFLLGFYYQQATFYSSSNETATFLAKSSYNYEEFIKLSHRYNEIHYYAQMQIAFIQQSLNQPWAIIQQSFLKAYAFDPVRGEALHEIIRYYVAAKKWETAYIFSSFAKYHFFDKRISEQRKLPVDNFFYNWGVLDYHISICSQLQKWQDATNSFFLLQKQIQQHPEYFTNNDIQSILEKFNSLQKKRN